MAHLAPHLKHHHHHHHHPQQPPTAAIFSPSVARAAASTAKDWSYVDDWLHRKYGRRHKPPPFERNPDTLKALLALAAANEAADEERAQLLRIEEAALEEERQLREQRDQQTKQKQRGDQNDSEESGAQIAEGILTALEEGLTREGRAALDAMTSMAVELGEATPTPQKLAASFVELQGQLSEAEMAAKRVVLLQKYLEDETARIDRLLRKIRGSSNSSGGGGGGGGEDDGAAGHHHHHRNLHSSENDEEVEVEEDGRNATNANANATLDLEASLATLSQQNLTLQRAVKAAATKLPELEQQVSATERAVGGAPRLAVDEVAADEAAYLELLNKKRDLDRRIEAFAGLPPDVDAARAELEGFRAELRGLTERRDADFEMLVERESPVKTRRAGRRV